MGNRVAGYGKAAVSACLFGLIALFTTVLYGAGATGFEIVFWRLASAAVAMGLYCRARGIDVRLHTARPAWVLIASLLYAGGIVFLCLAYGTESSTGLMSTVYHTYPLLVMVASALFCSRRPSGMKIIAGPCAVAGAALVLLAGRRWDFTVGGVVLALASALCYALYSLALERNELKAMPSSAFLLYGCVVGAIACLPFMLVAPTHMAARPLTVGVSLLLGVVCTAVPYLLYIDAARAVGSMPAALLSYLEYPVTLVLMALVCGDVPGVPELAGCVLIALAGVMTVLPERPRRAGGVSRRRA